MKAYLLARLPAAWLGWVTLPRGARHAMGILFKVMLPALAGMLLLVVLAAETTWLRLLAVGFFLPTLYLLWQMQYQLLIPREQFCQTEEKTHLLEELVGQRATELESMVEQLEIRTMEQDWAKQALEHQLNYAEQIIAAVGDPLIVVTSRLHISRINPAVAKITGYEPAELLGQPLDKILRVFFARPEEVAAKINPLALALTQQREIHDRPAILIDRAGKVAQGQLQMRLLREKHLVVGAVLVCPLAVQAEINSSQVS